MLRGEVISFCSFSEGECSLIALAALASQSSLAKAAGDPTVKNFNLFGHSGQLDWTQTAEGLIITLSHQKMSDYAWLLKITSSGLAAK